MFFAGTSLQTSKFPDEFFIIYLQKIFKSISRIRRLFLGPGGILVAAAKKATPYLLSGISAREDSGRQTILPPFSQKGRLFIWRRKGDRDIFAELKEVKFSVNGPVRDFCCGLAANAVCGREIGKISGGGSGKVTL